MLQKICNHPDLFHRKMGRLADDVVMGEPARSGKMKVRGAGACGRACACVHA
jgi:hypothetical protein